MVFPLYDDNTDRPRYPVRQLRAHRDQRPGLRVPAAVWAATSEKFTYAFSTACPKEIVTGQDVVETDRRSRTR